MSIEKLQERIRKLKNPSVIDFSVATGQIPSFLLEEEGSFLCAYGRFCRENLNALKEIAPAVRFSYPYFAALGPEGLTLLRELLDAANSYGFYIILDCFEFWQIQVAEAAMTFLQTLPVDGYVCPLYSGADGIKPYVNLCSTGNKSLFAVVRTANKTASQLQDLMTGSRLVHMAATDIAVRMGERLVGKSGYSQVAVIAAANSQESLRSLRNKHKNLFILVDGYDYANANAKNCSYAFDGLGHGAIVCSGAAVTAAWCNEEVDPHNYIESTVRAAQRMRKNITRYVTVL